ncbi:hypothetical protein [Bradyrhizobium cajani]|uniref:hypothetical protein n=1 Tax=Bradyrhizobium cajani TaxID=1928661 RepID=UPI001FE587AA|nr:hypothetical protein [Bradyrhizobium cajani]MCP3372733.1 hypothetical protein [Bradyrhizobium cajani]
MSGAAQVIGKKPTASFVFSGGLRSWAIAFSVSMGRMLDSAPMIALAPTLRSTSRRKIGCGEQAMQQRLLDLVRHGDLEGWLGWTGLATAATLAAEAMIIRCVSHVPCPVPASGFKHGARR